MSLSQKILAVLAESPLAISTPDLIVIVAPDTTNARQKVWDRLEYLWHKGLVVKAMARTRVSEGLGANKRVAIWRLA